MVVFAEVSDRSVFVRRLEACRAAKRLLGHEPTLGLQTPVHRYQLALEHVLLLGLRLDRWLFKSGTRSREVAQSEANVADFCFGEILESVWIGRGCRRLVEFVRVIFSWTKIEFDCAVLSKKRTQVTFLKPKAESGGQQAI